MDDVLCPSCKHSLGYHRYYYGTCEAPVGGSGFNKCGCNMTIYTFIKDLQNKDSTKETEALRLENMALKSGSESLTLLMTEVNIRINYLEHKLKIIEEILKEAKLVDTTPFYGHFKINYKKKIHELLDKALLELEKINE